MSDKFQNKYRIQSARLQNWDYGSNAMYFVTICTQNRVQYFGNIVETQNFASPQIQSPTMQLSEIGKIANQYWNEIPLHFPFVELGEFVVMPNHVHGIIIINKPDDANAVVVETQNFASLREQQNKFGPQSKNLASIIRGFKSGVKKYATMNHIDFAWQSRFHDHIIRNDESFQRISEYIRNNPLNWLNDKLYNIAP
jgi:putative transposase